MTELNNQINNKIKFIQKQIQILHNQLNDFLEYTQEESLELPTKQKPEEQIKSLETLLDRIQEIIQQKIELNKTKETIITNINEIFQIHQLKDDIIEDYHDKIVFQLFELKENKQEKELFIKESSKTFFSFLNTKEIKQFEEWTKKKYKEILFDSNEDNWSVNTSVFDEKIMNKNNLLFLIEDINKNKFGGFLSSTINSFDSYVTDDNAFLFSLQSNKKPNEMKKFEIKEKEYAFQLNKKIDKYDLFSFGNGFDICIHKKSYINGGYCFQQSFEYEGISNALINDTEFIIKHFIVIQMI